MERPKIYNVISKRYLEIGGKRYNELIKAGYFVNDQGQLDFRETEISIKSTKTNVIPNIGTIPKPNIGSVLKPNNISVPKPTLEKQINYNRPIPKPNISNRRYNIVNPFENFTPQELLSLYLNKNEHRLDNPVYLDELSIKYNIHENPKSFLEFMRYYNLTIVNSKLAYLYDLENNIEIPSNEYVEKLKNGQRLITEKMRAILVDWLFSVNKVFKMNKYVIGLTITTLDIYLSKGDVNKENLQLIGLACLSLAELILSETQKSTRDYIYISDNAYTEKQFIDMKNKIFETLNGILIRPSVVFFLDMNNSILRDFAYFSYFVPLMNFKPSLIAETINHIVNGEYKIYTIGEISHICRILIPMVKRTQNTSLQFLKKIANNIDKFISYVCKTDISEFKELPFKYNNNWHIGEFEKLEILGKGTYGEVFKIKRKTCGLNYAIKVSKNRDMSSFLETVNLNLIKSENVINLCGFKIEGNKFEMYLPFMGSDLQTLVKHNKFDMNKFPKYAEQMIKGLYQIHFNDIIHRDIKPDNIVYDEKDDLFKFIDFGISVPYSSTRDYLDPYMAATINYRAPEALLNQQYNYKIDIWALGCIFYSIFHKRLMILLHDYNVQNVINEIFSIFGSPTEKEWPGINNIIDRIFKYQGYKFNMNYKRNENKLKSLFGKYYDLIMPCFVLNPDDRADTIELLNIIMKYT